MADELCATLLGATTETVARIGPAAALTGPAARGDPGVLRLQETVGADWHPEAADLCLIMSAFADRLKHAGTTLATEPLAPPGEARGPDGDLLAFWRETMRLRLNRPGEIADLIGLDRAEDVAGWLDVGQDRARTHGPLAGVVAVLRAVLEADDRAERVACLLSDVVLALALNWRAVRPVSAQRLTKVALRDLTAEGQGSELAVQVRVLESIEETIRLARDLARRAEGLRIIAPKLRPKGSGAAVELFLTEDAVASASMLSPRILGTSIPMPGPRARREARAVRSPPVFFLMQSP